MTAQVPRATPFLTINRPLCLQAPKVSPFGGFCVGPRAPRGGFIKGGKVRPLYLRVWAVKLLKYSYEKQSP